MVPVCSLRKMDSLVAKSDDILMKKALAEDAGIAMQMQQSAI